MNTKKYNEVIELSNKMLAQEKKKTIQLWRHSFQIERIIIIAYWALI